MSPMEMSSASPMELMEMFLGHRSSGRPERHAMTVIQVSDRELSRSRVVMELADGRLTVAAAAELMGLGRQQVFRLRRAFATAGPFSLICRKRRHRSNRRHGAAFWRTVLTLVRERYSDFEPTLTAERACHTARAAPRCRDAAAIDDRRKALD
jgi:Winged helix-turn helix